MNCLFSLKRLIPYLFVLSFFTLSGILLSGCQQDITCVFSTCPSPTQNQVGGTTPDVQATVNASVHATQTASSGNLQITPVTPVSQSTSVNCNKRVATGVGNTATYSFTVPQGCVAVVTGVNVTGIPNSWSDGGGGIEGLQPSSYTVTILDGSYQIGTTAAGQAMWCNLYTWEQQNGKADTYNYPIDGWSSTC